MSCRICGCNSQAKSSFRIENSESSDACALESLLDAHNPPKDTTQLCLNACNITSIEVPEGSAWAPLYSSLTSLDLGNNKIAEIPDTFFSHFPHLKYLNFSYNRIANIPTTIESLTEVETVLFEKNLLRETSVPLASILNLTYLKAFNVYGNYIDTAKLAESAASTVPPSRMSMVPFLVSYMLVGAWNQYTPSRIDDGVFLGSVENTEAPEELRHLGITHILSVGVPPAAPEGFTTKYISALDFPSVPLIRNFDDAVDFIESARESGGACLVHCAAGRSRSATCVCAWLIKKRGMSASEALDHVKKARKCVSPNLGFVEQLNVYAQRFPKKIDPKP